MNDGSPREHEDFEQLLDKLERCGEGRERVTVREVHEAVGERSFGPLLALVGLAGVTPLSAVPSVPSILALCIALVAVQMLIGKRRLWLPGWIVRRHVRTETLRKSVRLARRPARVVDRLLRPRWTGLTGPWASRLVALVCVGLALIVPPLELVPLAAGLPSLAVLAFGLGLIGRDGLWVAVALVVSAGSLALVAQRLMG